MSALVLLEREGSVAKVTLNRPEAANALDMPVARALLEVATECDSDDSIRCVTMTGAGRMFCAGGDVSAMAAAGDKVGAMVGDLASTLHLAMSRFARMNKPLVTLVNGPAAGAGYGMALSGDVVLCGRAAVFNAAYGMLGVSPDGGLTWLLPRLVGLRKAQEIILTNRKVTAEEAEALGMVTRVVDDEALAAEGAAVAAKLASGAIGAIARSRALLLNAYDNSWETHLELEARGIAGAIAGPEGREGVAAFLGKRKPDFANAK
ncbi:enoyl-CoA hydratase/isomerase family protein [Rhizorhabdus sp.]|uniref:enoyl-CoA hydratase/isomerase family protein n=1 Tax=Rhizorhabdus sp. TaxID=1968843 RepID=UPI0035AE9AEE